MAHQAHNLPWNNLASHLTYVYQYRKYHCRTHFFPLNGPQQGKSFGHFAKVFERTINEFASTHSHSRTNWAANPAPLDEAIIDEETAGAIRKSIQYARIDSESRSNGIECPLHLHCCRQSNDHICSCETVTDNPYVLRYWLNVFRCAGCCRRLGYAEIINLTKVLLLHDQMTPLLRLASHPDIKLREFYDIFWEFGEESRYGWRRTLLAALYPYIALNVIYLKPETWLSRNPTGSTQNPVDYRLTAFYQRAIHQCTYTNYYDVDTLPHRRFFGIPHHAIRYDDYYHLDLFFKDDEIIENSYQYRSYQSVFGYFPLQAHFDGDTRSQHVPTAADLDSVVAIFNQKFRLPYELILIILDMAGYTVQSRLLVGGDPMHPDNADELRKYLSYCWKLLIRCDLLAKVDGTPICWEAEVQDCIFELVMHWSGLPKRTKWLWEEMDDWRQQRQYMLGPNLRRFL